MTKRRRRFNPISLGLIVICLLGAMMTPTRAQNTGDVFFGAGLDLYKTDNLEFAGKLQFGAEANYFVTRKLAIGGGFEFWTTNNNSLVLGFRYFPVNRIFARFRGLVGQNDLAFGAGYSYPTRSNLRLELIGDYFLDQDEFAIRVGVVFHRKRY